MRLGAGIGHGTGLIAGTLAGPVNQVAPQITGSGRVGDPLTFSPGSWTGSGPVTIAYRWLREGAPIAGATTESFLPVDEDEGLRLSGIVTASDDTGSRGRGVIGPMVVWPTPTATRPLPDLALDPGVAMTPADLAGGFSGRDMRFDLGPGSAPLPDGLTLSAAGVLSGTPSAETPDARIVIRALNSGGAAQSAFQLRVGLSGETPLLLIIAGQSNADKQGTSGITLPAKYGNLSDVEIWNPVAGVFEAYAPGTNAGDDSRNAWGSEAEFAHQLREAGDTRPIRVVKRAQGGTGLEAEAGRDDWHPVTQTGGRQLFDELEARVTAARAAIGTTTEDVTIWAQGEYDMAKGFAGSYAANFGALLSEWRSRISTGLFIVERTRPRLDSTTARAGTWIVRQVQLDLALADGNAAVIDTDAATNGAPFSQLHPNHLWCEDCGLRAYRGWRGNYTEFHGDITGAVPAAFALADRTSVAQGAVVTSDVLSPRGFERDTDISITDGEYRITNPDDTVFADWTAAPGKIHKHQKVQLRITASDSAEMAVVATLTIGGVTGRWSVTTQAAQAPAGITHVASGLPTTANGAHDVPMPAGVAAGDLLLLHVSTHSNNYTETTPPGWTALPEVRSGSTNSDQARGIIYWKLAGEAEPSVTLTQGSYYSTGIVTAFRGVDPSDPIAVVQPGAATTSNSIAEGLVAAPVMAGTHVVYAAVIGEMHSATWSDDPDLADFAERYDVQRQGSSGAKQTLTMASGGSAVAQSVGDAVTATIDGGARRNINAHLLALRPA